MKKPSLPKPGEGWRKKKKEVVRLHAALNALSALGLKRTRPREILLRHLVQNHGPFSARELYAAVKEHGLNATTSYRALAIFEEAGLVRRFDFGDGIARFEFNEGRAHHHHVICTDCRKIEPIADCHLGELEKKVEGMGYSKVQHDLKFTGLCRECSRKSA